MTLYDRRALLMEFTKWCADHGYLDSSFGGVDAFLASLPEPIPACPVCGAVRGDWECRHGAKDEPVPLNLGRRDGEDVPPAPERFWRVARLVPGECWQMVIVDADGLLVVGKDAQRGPCHYERDYHDPSIARNMAEADGVHSGLPRWPGGGK
jgi:hypothetical protein